MAAIARYFDASTFDAFRFLSSKLKISNVRELGHEFSHSLGHEATVGGVDPMRSLTGQVRAYEAAESGHWKLV